ncbi:MAG: DMT family transporter [Pseudomonadota bacterium]
MSAPPAVAVSQGTKGNPIAGAGLILLASAFVAASTLCAKMLGTGEGALSAFQVTWGRYVFGLLALLLVATVVRPHFTAPQWPLHVLRVGCGAAGVTCMFAAAALIPLADATAISFLNPVIAMLLAIPILAERIGPIRWSMAALALFGALLLIRPGASTFQPAALIALLAALLMGVEVIALKLLAGREGAFQVVLIANALGALFATVALVFGWQWPTPPQWLLMVATGVLMVTAQGFYTNALRIGDASFVLPFSYATLIFAALYDLILFDVVPVPLSLLGGLIIIVSGIILAWRDSKSRAG